MGVLGNIYFFFWRSSTAKPSPIFFFFCQAIMFIGPTLLNLFWICVAIRVDSPGIFVLLAKISCSWTQNTIFVAYEPWDQMNLGHEKVGLKFLETSSFILKNKSLHKENWLLSVNNFREFDSAMSITPCTITQLDNAVSMNFLNFRDQYHISKYSIYEKGVQVG